MNRRKSAGFTVDDALWRRFKSKAADEGLPIGEILVKLVRKYLEGKDEAVGNVRRKIPLKEAPAEGKKRRTLETSASEKVSDPRLAEYASRLSIKDKNENSLREKVLDAVEKEYGERAGEEGWVKSNLEMLQWYNGSRG